MGGPPPGRGSVTAQHYQVLHLPWLSVKSLALKYRRMAECGNSQREPWEIQAWPALPSFTESSTGLCFMLDKVILSLLI